MNKFSQFSERTQQGQESLLTGFVFIAILVVLLSTIMAGADLLQ